MPLETAEKIRRLIEKECMRDSLADLCDDWGVTIEDFDAFLNAAMDAVKDSKEKEKEN